MLILEILLTCGIIWRKRGQEFHRAKASAESSGATTSSSKKHQMTIGEAVKVSEPLLLFSPRWKTLTESVCYFIARDLQPFDTLNDTGFRRMVNTLEPGYKPPNRKTVATNNLSKMFDHEKEKIRQQMSSVKSFALTTDIWSSHANHSYTGLKFHYITTEYERDVLETKEFSDSHTGSNIADELLAILSDWNLSPTMMSAITTDNGANIVLATNILNQPRMACFSHTLQLTVEAATSLSQLSRLVLLAVIDVSLDSSTTQVTPIIC